MSANAPSPRLGAFGRVGKCPYPTPPSQSPRFRIA